MADTNKATAETSADLHYDLSKINIDQPVHELIDQGKKFVTACHLKNWERLSQSNGTWFKESPTLNKR